MPSQPEREKVILHPLVLLSVVDHYNRVAKDTKKRVVGVLLGEVHKGVVDVSNSFARKCERDACVVCMAMRVHVRLMMMPMRT